VLFGVFGAPSPLSYWAFGAVRTVVDLCFPRHSVLAATGLTQVREALAQSGDDPMIVYSDSPEIELVEAFASAGAPYLICLEAPLEVLGFCMAERAIQPIDALRLTTLTMSTLRDLALSPKARILRRAPDLKTSDCIIQICSAFGLASDAAIAREALRRFAALTDVSDPLIEDLLVKFHAPAKPLGAYSASLASGAAPAWVVQTANDYLPVTTGEAVSAISWPQEAFLDPRAKDNAINPLQELIGPSRLLLYGPYLNLPRGTWFGTVDMEVVDGRWNALSVDVTLQGQSVSTAQFDLPDRGRFQFVMKFEIAEPRDFIEMRVTLLKGAIEGKIAIRSVRMERAAPN